jgi:hypothetical protein
MPEDSDRDDLYAMSDEVMKRILEIDDVETVGSHERPAVRNG